MNCTDVQQHLYIDPARIPAETRAHLEDCGACRAVMAGIERLDAQVLDVLHSSQREGLKARAVLSQRLRRRNWRAGLALAGSLLLVLASTLLLTGGPDEGVQPKWGTVMAQHVIDDPQHERLPDPDAVNGLRHSLAEFGLVGKEGLPPVLRAGLCQLRNRMAAHLVFEVKGERVVAIVMDQGAEQGSLEHAGWSGELRTLQGRTVGVFARDPGLARSVSDSLLSNLVSLQG